MTASPAEREVRPVIIFVDDARLERHLQTRLRIAPESIPGASERPMPGHHLSIEVDRASAIGYRLQGDHSMTLNLAQTLAWKKSLAATSPDAAAELAMLHDLQGNILKGHGRRCTSNVFVTFDPAQAAAGRKFIASLGHDVTTALDQLTGAEAHQSNGTDAGVFLSVLVSGRFRIMPRA